jgi:hypothetical protein
LRVGVGFVSIYHQVRREHSTYVIDSCNCGGYSFILQGSASAQVISKPFFLYCCGLQCCLYKKRVDPLLY